MFTYLIAFLLVISVLFRCVDWKWFAVIGARYRSVQVSSSSTTS